jgi:hypothetical protein
MEIIRHFLGKETGSPAEIYQRTHNRRIDMLQAVERQKLISGQVQKSPTGIVDLDEMTNGGLPKGVPDFRRFALRRFSIS